MALKALKTSLEEIQNLRNLYLQENNFQIRYNACHSRGWTDSYLISKDGIKIGYGAIKGKENISDRDTVFEFYLLPAYRNLALTAFSTLLDAAAPAFLESQSNDLLTTSMLYQFGKNINADVVLFGEGFSSELKVENVQFRSRKATDVLFDHQAEPIGDFVLELAGEVVATGGFLLHYNPPFADLYMEVREDHRKKGLGSFLIQELKKQCYLAGRVPAARTGIDNHASSATLRKAGLKMAGFMLLGALK